MPKFKMPSRKVLRTIYRTGWLNVWEGSVRSSKTLISTVAWLVYISECDDKYFLMTGKTLGSLLRNVFEGDMGIKAMIPGAQYVQTAKGNAILIPTPKGVKTCYCFGGNNANSYQSIRGVTVAGWYADEVSEQHPDTIIECFNRTVVSSDRRHFWTLNPCNPKHAIYTEYLDKYDAMTKEERRTAGGYYWHHFTLEDNPGISQKEMEALKMQYTGFAYDRYILGLRVVAEGLIYPFIDDSHFPAFNPRDVECRYASIDFGTNHPTVMYIGGPYRGDRSDWRIAYEYYDEKSGKDTRDYTEDFIKMCTDHDIDPHKVIIAIDPSARALKNSFIKAGLTIMDADNSVLDGINFTYRVLNKHKLTLHCSCIHAHREFGTYAWDPKASERGEEKPIKLGDDCMDSLRYFAHTFMSYMEKGEYQ